MVVYVIDHKCNTVDGYENMNSFTNCKDDSEWFVKTSNKEKKYCRHIGKSASCYDRDSVGREGWERCLKTCGNCANTKVTKAPMGILAGFSGDPYDDFGVVLHSDKDREWVGSTGKKGGTDDKEEDIDDLQERLDSIEDTFDMITGDIKSCDISGSACTSNHFKGCDNQCLQCPAKGDSSKKKRSYIKQSVDKHTGHKSIQFPAKNISCSSVPKILKDESNDGLKYELEYTGCYTDNPTIGTREMEGLTWDKIKGVKNIPTPKKCPNSASEYCVLVEGDDVDKKNQCATYCTARGIDAEYMGIQYGNQCFCSKDKPSTKEGDPISKCGLGGNKCFVNKSTDCSNHNAVFRINGVKMHSSDIINTCKEYLLFDKLGDDDDDDKKQKKKDDHKISLYDMCPRECKVTECN